MALRAEVDKLSAARRPTACTSPLTTTIRSTSSPRGEKCACGSTLKVESLHPGQELLLNEALKVVAAAGYEIQGDVALCSLCDDYDPRVAYHEPGGPSTAWAAPYATVG
jgi:hypothetical protein